MERRFVWDAAQQATALAFSPQLPLDPQVGSLLSEEPRHIPAGVELTDEAHFRVNFYAPTAREVALRTLEGVLPLRQGADGVWSEVLERGEGGFRPLFFLVDGAAVLNPMAPLAFGASAPVNAVDLPQPGVDFYHLKDVPHGAVTQEFYFSSVLGRWESCLVYTPPGYRQGAQRYPVLYLQHGHGENERCWVHQGKVNFILDNLLAQGKAKPCLIVMNNGMVQRPGEPCVCIAPELLEPLLTEDCIPFIDGSYRTLADREHRAMAGLSMGSLQTSMTVLRHPELFAWAGVFSGFLQPLPAITQATAYLRALEDAAAFSAHFRLFFRAMGRQDPFRQHFAADGALLAAKGLAPGQCPAHRERWYPGGHEWNVWRLCARDFLQLLFQ